MKRTYKTRGIVRALAVVGALSLVASASHATLLNLVLPENPDLYIAYVSMNYTASTTLFEAIGQTDTYIDPDNNYNQINDLPATYDLKAYITSAGQLTNGTVTILGDTDYDNIPETLLTGNLSLGYEGAGFGASTGVNSHFEFLFTITGGDLASVFGGIGAGGGIVFFPDGGSTFTDSWTSDFHNGGAGYADNAPAVPEPSTCLLFVLGVAMCVATHRRHKHTRAP